MLHVAIDLGGRESQICVREEDGSLVKEGRWPTAKLEKLLEEFPAGSRVVVETCAEAFSTADAARAAGHEPRVVPATLVRSLGVGQRGIKTDKRDARCLSEVSTRIELPSVHIRSEQSRMRKTLCGMREGLVSSRTQLVNQVRGWLRGQRQRLSSGAVETFTARVRKHFGEQELPRCVARHLATIDALSEQIKDADAEVHAEAKSDVVCQRLMSVPGIGPVSALRYVAAVDTPERFHDAHALESHLGLTPGEKSSGDKTRRTSVTKAGDTAVRRTLVQSAWTLRRCRPGDPIVRWCYEVEKRRGKQVAIVALARKLAGVLFAMWRDGTTYQPQRAAAVPVS